MEANELTGCELYGYTKYSKNSQTGGKNRISAKVVGKSVEKLLIVLSSLLPDNIFIKKTFVTPCILKNSNEINSTILLGIKAAGYSFINPSMARCVCD